MPVIIHGMSLFMSMVKRTGHILMVFLLLFGTTGMTITKHYCGKVLVHSAIYSTADNCCQGNCPGCHNEKISLRITDQFESTQDRSDFVAGFQTMLEQVSLPTLLAFSNLPVVYMMNDGSGGPRNIPYSSKPICAEQTPSVLQVFLF